MPIPGTTPSTPRADPPWPSNSAAAESSTSISSTKSPDLTGRLLQLLPKNIQLIGIHSRQRRVHAMHPFQQLACTVQIRRFSGIHEPLDFVPDQRPHGPSFLLGCLNALGGELDCVRVTAG